MNPDLKKTQPYPFERLATLKAGVTPPAHLSPIALSIGEPKHAPPPFVLEVIKNSLAGYSAYPTTAGSDELRDTCARWLERRFGLGADAVRRANVLPVSGTREAPHCSQGPSPISLRPLPRRAFCPISMRCRPTSGIGYSCFISAAPVIRAAR
jgi:hypothetical protein